MRLADIQKGLLEKLKAGKLPLDKSFLLVGVPDFSRSLPADAVAVYVGGDELTRDASFEQDEEIRVLLYGSPGMHPGDMHKVRVEYPPALRAMINGVDIKRINVVFFPTVGARSLADQIKGGDFDGDKYGVIACPTLVRLFERQSKPYDPKLPNSVSGKSVRQRSASDVRASRRLVAGTDRERRTFSLRDL